MTPYGANTALHGISPPSKKLETTGNLSSLETHYQDKKAETRTMFTIIILSFALCTAYAAPFAS